MKEEEQAMRDKRSRRIDALMVLVIWVALVGLVALIALMVTLTVVALNGGGVSTKGDIGEAPTHSVAPQETWGVCEAGYTMMGGVCIVRR